MAFFLLQVSLFLAMELPKSFQYLGQMVPSLPWRTEGLYSSLQLPSSYQLWSVILYQNNGLENISINAPSLFRCKMVVPSSLSNQLKIS